MNLDEFLMIIGATKEEVMQARESLGHMTVNSDDPLKIALFVTATKIRRLEAALAARQDDLGTGKGSPASPPPDSL